MSVTNTEIIQIAINMFGVVLCLTSALILIVSGLNKITKNLMWMFAANMFLLAFDSCAYLFRGNTDIVGIGMTRVSNFFCFFLEVCLMCLACKLLHSILVDAGICPSKYFSLTIVGCSIVSLLILVFGQFSGFMYYFDELNYYHRSIGWYVFTGLLGLSLLLLFVEVVTYYGQLPKNLARSLIIITLIPLVLAVLQIPFYGYSLANAGVAIAIVLTFVEYLHKDINLKLDRGENDMHERNLISTILVFFITVLCMSASIITCVQEIQKIADENLQKEERILVQNIEGHVTKELLKPITVAKTMSQNKQIQRLLKRDPSDENTKIISDYLKSIKNDFGYQTVFAVSDRTKAFYTYTGVQRYIDPGVNVHDVWLSDFEETEKKMELNIDTDEMNNFALSIFVNVRMQDEELNRIGTCGVSVDLSYIQDIIREYEEDYGVRVFFTDKEGNVLVSSNEAEIRHLKEDTTHYKHSYKDMYFERTKDEDKVVTFIPELNWYLVVHTSAVGDVNVVAVVLPSIIIFILGLMVMGIVFWGIYARGRNIQRELRNNRRVTYTDALTGIHNRHAYEHDTKELQESGEYKDMILVMMDVNGLKTVNDSAGHDAGDEFLMGATDCMMAAFSKYGKVYRTGGDEFISLLTCSREELEEAFIEFHNMSAEWRGKAETELSVSKGFAVAAEHPEMSLKELEKLADKYMYIDKNEYYRRTGKDRRMTW